MCKWYEINIEPRDVLFFRGAKPMGASAIGEGANWPMPSVFHQALLSAFHARWPDAKTNHQHIRAGENQNSTFLYGDLQTVGVFPSIGNERYFPMPADVQCKDKDGKELCVLQPGELEGKSDLPKPLTMGLFKEGEATKEKPQKWISSTNLQKYLAGKIKKEEVPVLFDVESRPGIGINPESGTTEDGQFYIAETMRLRDGVSLKGFATGTSIENYFATDRKCEFVFGGQRGIAFLNGVRDDAKLPAFGKTTGTRIKWVLLTPAIFTGGWLPRWVDKKTGTICGAETTKPERLPQESRKAWRARFKIEPIPGKLVAANIPKPIPTSGWKAHGGTEGPRPTRLCVPAGAVYYFETENEEETKALLQFLDGKRKSDIAAEKGFGFGVCGIWNQHKGENK